MMLVHAVAFRTNEKTRNCEYRQWTMDNTRIVLPVASTIARAEICLGCWRDCPFLNRTHLVLDEVVPMGGQYDRTPTRLHLSLLQSLLFRWEGSRQHDRTPTRLHLSLLQSLWLTSAWPDWSKLQFLRPRFEPHEQRPTRHEASALTTRPRVRCASAYNVRKLDFQANLCAAFAEDKMQHYCGDLVLGWGV